MPRRATTESPAKPSPQRRSPPRSPAPAGPKSLPEPQRIRLMWIAVIAAMTVIAVAWVISLRWLGGGKGNESLIRSIYEQVRGAFTDEAQPSVTTPADDAKIRELRSRVFPEFAAPSEPTP